MRNTLLIARQEFVKYITRRGFWISIFLFPLWIAIIVEVPQWTGASDSPQLFTVIDHTGGFTAAIRAAVTRDDARHRRARFVMVGHAPSLDNVSPNSIAQALKPYFAGNSSQGTLAAALFIPAEFGSNGRATARYFARNDSNSELREFLSGALTDTMRLDKVMQVAPDLVRSGGLDISATLDVHRVARSGNADDDDFGSLVPVGLALVLFIVSVMNASVLLQGVIEEKSTRMIEVLLSCATARQITTGKLIGVIAVALITIAIWGGALLALMALAGQGTVTSVIVALKSVAADGAAPLLLLYFICGLLIYGSVFLAIGSMANSLADAQSLLGPSMLILMVPNVLIGAVLREPNGSLASWMSWIPIYTPYFMMLRLASHPPIWQIWGTAALALTTTALLILWMGRVFSRHVLSTERPPSLGLLMSRIFKGATSSK